MPFKLPPLPYAKSALAPVISEKTMELHYEKHHRGYVDKLNKLVASMPYSSMQIEELMLKTWGRPEATTIFNNAAQVWNHTFFWHSMKPSGGQMSSSLRGRLEADFQSIDAFKNTFVQEAVEQFGTGYVWIVREGDRLNVMTTDDAIPPMVVGLQPLLTCDLWEHAYYLDYHNKREDFVRAFIDKLANWEFVEQQLAVRRATPAEISRSVELGH